jgi:hypothetical protein
MPLKSTWIEQPRILALDCTGDFTSEEIDSLGQTALSLITEPAYILIDFDQITTLPKNLVNTALRSNSLQTFATHPAVRQIAFVRPNSALHYLIDTIFRNLPSRVFESRDDAIAFLKSESAARPGE